jgi:hypothetical protein
MRHLSHTAVQFQAGKLDEIFVLLSIYTTMHSSLTLDTGDDYISQICEVELEFKDKFHNF